MRTLKVTSGPSKGQSLEVEEELVIGREHSDFAIPMDVEVSRRHAVVRPTESGIEVEDLGSTNGTFVDGRKIDGTAAVTASGTIRVGETEIAVELELPPPSPPADPGIAPDVTAPRAIPQPDVTAPRAIAQPDFTAPRDVPDKAPEPEVTEPKEIPQPDVTAPRAIPQPDVTAPRKVPDKEIPQPDVTAPRAIPQPDVTAPRAVASPDVTAPRKVPPAPPGEKPPAPEEEGPGGPNLPLIAGAVVAAVLLVLAILLLTGGDDSTSRRANLTVNTSPATARDADLATAPAGPRGVAVTYAGQVSGLPFGAGSATIEMTRLVSRRGAPEQRRASLIFRFDSGTVRATASARQSRGQRGRFTGSGRFTGGTGDFEGISGGLKLTIRRADARRGNEVLDLTGTAEY
jgi:hypothetical protein